MSDERNQASEARALLLKDAVHDARVAAENGNWRKVKSLIALATEIAKDLPKKDVTDTESRHGG